MHSAAVQELADVCRRDTEVCVPALRAHRIRAAAATEERTMESHDLGPISGPWVDPGDTLATASPIQLILREAIVRRNHQVERPAAPIPNGCTGIDWARCADRSVSVKRIGRGVLRVQGRPASLARVSLGIEGLGFTIAVAPGGSPAEAIAGRLEAHYQVETIEESGDSVLVVLKAPSAHTTSRPQACDACPEDEVFV